jgi:hypothetical protein
MPSGPGGSTVEGYDCPYAFGQLRAAGDAGGRVVDDGWSAGASAEAAGVGGSAGRHFATKTVRSSIPSPIAIASSHAFIWLAIRSRWIRRSFIRNLALYLFKRLHEPTADYAAMQHEILE